LPSATIHSPTRGSRFLPPKATCCMSARTQALLRPIAPGKVTASFAPLGRVLFWELFLRAQRKAGHRLGASRGVLAPGNAANTLWLSAPRGRGRPGSLAPAMMLFLSRCGDSFKSLESAALARRSLAVISVHRLRDSCSRGGIDYETHRRFVFAARKIVLM